MRQRLKSRIQNPGFKDSLIRNPISCCSESRFVCSASEGDRSVPARENLLVYALFEVFTPFLFAHTRLFLPLHSFPRWPDHYFSGMSNRVENQKLNKVVAELPTG